MQNDMAGIERKRGTVGVCLFLALTTLLLYLPATGNGLVNLDDNEYIVDNPHVTAGLTGPDMAWAFRFTGYASNWHPLTWISHWLDCELYGLNAGGHHLTSLLFHVADSLLLFLLLRQMTGARWAQRARGGVVRVASAARGIGGVGVGTEGCVEHVFLAADDDGVCEIR